MQPVNLHPNSPTNLPNFSVFFSTLDVTTFSQIPSIKEIVQNPNLNKEERQCTDIPFYVYIKITPNHNASINSFTIKPSPDLNPKINLMVQNQNQGNFMEFKHNFSVETKSNPLIAVFRVLAHTNSSKIEIPLLFEYEAQKEKEHITNSNIVKLSILTQSPIDITTHQIPVHSDGLIVQLVMVNRTQYALYDFNIKFSPSSEFHIEEPEIPISEVFLSGDSFSAVLPLEIKPGENVTPKSRPGTAKISWGIKVDNDQMIECEHDLVIEARDPKYDKAICPIKIAMIGSPQYYTAVVPFTVKLDVHNDSQEKSLSFIISFDSNTDINSYLKPYKDNFFRSENLQSQMSLSQNNNGVEVQFIGLAQGFLKYPDIHIQIINDKPDVPNSDFAINDKSDALNTDFIIPQDQGVFIVPDASAFIES